MAIEKVPRFQPCYILRDNNIPCVVWCEDAVAHHGVPTVVFSFYLLVSDIDEAAKALVRGGWKLEDRTQTKFGNAPLRSAHHRLTPPTDMTRNTPTWSPGMGPPPPPSKDPPGPTTTILLPASEWNYILPETSDQSFIPSLPGLLDGLIAKLLDDPLTETMFWRHLSILIGYLYGYAPDLKQKSFAQQLKYEHRQFHYDSLSGMSTGTLPFLRHESKIREALRKGTYQLSDCSADPNDESLFTAKVQARILASTPTLFSPDVYEAERNGREE
jgi:hypothetical protein